MVASAQRRLPISIAEIFALVRHAVLNRDPAAQRRDSSMFRFEIVSACR